MERMQREEGGVPVRTVKSFMTKIPHVFTGQDLVQWLITNLHLRWGGEEEERYLNAWTKFVMHTHYKKADYGIVE